jgi:hypothetical protein
LGCRAAIARIRTQAVDRLGREGDKAAILEDTGGFGDPGGIGGGDFGLDVDHGG